MPQRHSAPPSGPGSPFGKPRDPQPGLGRVYAPDPRDAQYRVRQAISVRAAMAQKSRSHFVGKILDQGRSSECTRYSVTQLMQSTPIITKDALQATAGMYQWSQQNDEWPGQEPTYYGTSVRAALQYARKVMGKIDGFSWAFTMDEALSWLAKVGPLVVGTDWYSGMDAPDAKGHITPTGWIRGGHAYMISSVNFTQKRMRVVNSWGEGWGQKGKAWLSFDAFEYLVIATNGEAATVTETPHLKKAA